MLLVEEEQEHMKKVLTLDLSDWSYDKY